MHAAAWYGGTAQFCMVRYDMKQYGKGCMVRCCMIRLGTHCTVLHCMHDRTLLGTVWHDTVQQDTVRHNAVRHDTVGWYGTDTVPCDTVPRGTASYGMAYYVTTRHGTARRTRYGRYDAARDVCLFCTLVSFEQQVLRLRRFLFGGRSSDFSLLSSIGSNTYICRHSEISGASS